MIQDQTMNSFENGSNFEEWMSKELKQLKAAYERLIKKEEQILAVLKYQHEQNMKEKTDEFLTEQKHKRDIVYVKNSIDKENFFSEEWMPIFIFVSFLMLILFYWNMRRRISKSKRKFVKKPILHNNAADETISIALTPLTKSSNLEDVNIRVQEDAQHISQNNEAEGEINFRASNSPNRNPKRKGKKSKKQINASPSPASAVQDDQNDAEIDDCLICLDLLNHNLLHLKPCGHVFHRECIGEWFKTGFPLTCPKCRAVCRKVQ